jgi:hypothetical protein
VLQRLNEYCSILAQKIEQCSLDLSCPPTSFLMVHISEIIEQYPWNPQAREDWSDKEIYTHTVDPEDMSKNWVVPILPCMQDFAYVGFRVRANTQSFPTSVQIYTGDNKYHPIFTKEIDRQKDGFQTVNWTLFKFPLPYRLLCLEEDEIIMVVTFDDEVFGKVEFLAQKFDGLEDENDADLWFCDNDFCEKGWILNRNRNFYRLDTLTKRKEYPRAYSIYRVC